MGWRTNLAPCVSGACMLMLLGGVANANCAARDVAADDAAYGAYLAAECVTCHRTDGTNAGIPRITGWPVSEFTQALRAYQCGTREHVVMQMVVRRLGDAEIAALARYFKDLE